MSDVLELSCFQINSDYRQGMPLSPVLSIIVVDILAKGVNVKWSEIKYWKEDKQPSVETKRGKEIEQVIHQGRNKDHQQTYEKI